MPCSQFQFAFMRPFPSLVWEPASPALFLEPSLAAAIRPRTVRADSTARRGPAGRISKLDGVPARRTSSRAPLIGRLGRYPFHAHELQPQPAHQVEDAVQMRLIADLADEAGLSGTEFQLQPLEGGPEPLCQASPDRNPVSARLHVASFGDPSTVPSAPGEWLRPLPVFTRASPAYPRDRKLASLSASQHFTGG